MCSFTSDYSLDIIRMLAKNTETQKRGFKFTLPVIVPLAPQVRLIQEDSTSLTLYEIYEQYCDFVNQYKDEPQIYFVQKLKDASALENLAKRGFLTSLPKIIY